jgi:hypothetical protein
MSFDTYDNLKLSILDWLGRPNDPLLLPAVGDWIALFEAEARDRLQSRFAENLGVELYGDGGVYQLPDDCWAVHKVHQGRENLHFEPPWVLDERAADRLSAPGRPLYYTLEGLQLRINPAPDNTDPVIVDYQSGIPALSDRVTSNWLLKCAPDCYLTGSLICAEAYTGNDERTQLWVAQREASFERIRLSSIRALMAGPPMQIVPYGDTP